MRAAVLTAPEKLTVERRDAAAPGPGEVAVAIAAGGICGSDLHYFHHYRMGDFPVVEPFVLGHEGAGTVAAVGAGVAGLAVGDKVAVNPSSPCGACAYCKGGRELLCVDMRFLGSSRRTPHVQGLFTERFVTRAANCVKVPARADLAIAAFAEPLAVALHAVSRPGPLLGAEVLITGAGPIGALIVGAARLAGARRITVADVLDQPLAKAREMGADAAVNVSPDASSESGGGSGADALYDPAHPRGRFDVAFDASGSPDAVVACLKALRPDGVFVQVGTFRNPMVPIPTDLVMSKELRLETSFRFDREFDWAVDYLVAGRIDVSPLLTHSFPVEDVMEAFRTAGDRRQAMKVQIRF